MTEKPKRDSALARLAFSTVLLVLPACNERDAPIHSNKQEPNSTPAPLVVIYRNDFNGPVGGTFPEWTSLPITFHKTVSGETGSLPAGAVATVESPNRRERFLGEFGGPPVGKPGDPDWNRTRVDQTVVLTLKDLGKHTKVTVAFDLYILKSWDGNSKQYGPDRFMLRVAGGSILLDTTFSNNPKVKEDGSYQSYPAPSGKVASNAPQTGATSTGTLGYSNFFKDSVYHLSFALPHTEPTLTLEFSSSLFEGKGPADESWGLDNVVVSADAAAGAMNSRRLGYNRKPRPQVRVDSLSSGPSSTRSLLAEEP